VLGRRRENVEDAAAHRELAALADHVDPGVGQVDEPGDDGVELGLGPTVSVTGSMSARFGCHRLQQRSCRGDHDAQWRAEALVVGMGQPEQQHQPRADRIDARRQPLVRQRLPRREHRDRIAKHAAQFGGQIVGLAPGGVTTRSGPTCASALAANTRALAGPTRVRSLGLSSHDGRHPTTTDPAAPTQ